MRIAQEIKYFLKYISKIKAFKGKKLRNVKFPPNMTQLSNDKQLNKNIACKFKFKWDTISSEI